MKNAKIIHIHVGIDTDLRPHLPRRGVADGKMLLTLFSIHSHKYKMLALLTLRVDSEFSDQLPQHGPRTLLVYPYCIIGPEPSPIPGHLVMGGEVLQGRTRLIHSESLSTLSKLPLIPYNRITFLIASLSPLSWPYADTRRPRTHSFYFQGTSYAHLYLGKYKFVTDENLQHN